jgi:hypothetical protein
VLCSAALAYERKPDDVLMHVFLAAGRFLQVPTGCFVTARRALQGNPILLEVQERIMPTETAQ